MWFIMLRTIYNEIKKIRTINQHEFYDKIVPFGACHAENIKTKEKYIRKPPQILRNYYRNSNNSDNIRTHLEKWVNFLGPDNQAVMDRILMVLSMDKAEEATKELLAIRRSNDFYAASEFFYITFRYCIVGDIYSRKNLPQKSNSYFLQEFCNKVLLECGVSGKSGEVRILKLAQSGSQNPYILFEAAEIEFRKKDNRGISHKHQLAKAYEYYKQSSEIGHALSDWSLGWLAQKCCENAWVIKAYENMDEDEIIHQAIIYFKKSAEKGCIKAWNSLGNLAATAKWKKICGAELREADYYYKYAAEHGSAHGMFNYSGILEKKIMNMINSYDKWDWADLKDEEKDTRKNIKQDIQIMFQYLKNAADLYCAEACYRCALYYSHTEDKKISGMEKINFGGIKLNPNASLEYLKTAIEYENKKEPLYNAYLLFADITLTKEKILEYENLTTAQEYLAYLMKNQDFKKNGSSEQKKKLKTLNNYLYNIQNNT